MLKKVSLFMVLAIVILINSCKKNNSQEIDKEISTTNVVNKFFENTENLDNPVLRVIATLKKEQETNPNYIPNIVKQFGYPKWDKYLSNYQSRGNSRNTNSGDSVIYIPLVQNSDSSVNNSIQATLATTISIALRQNSEYVNYAFSNTANILGEADEYALIYLNLTNNVFNKKHFKITDQRLFKNQVVSTSTNFTRVVSLEVDSSAVTNGRSAPIGCGTISEFSVTDDCPHIGVCEVVCDGCSVCIQVTNNWDSFCGSGGGGSGSGNSGSGGTGSGGTGSGGTGSGTGSGGGSNGGGSVPMTQAEYVLMTWTAALQPGESVELTPMSEINPSNQFQWGNPTTFMNYFRNTLMAPLPHPVDIALFPTEPLNDTTIKQKLIKFSYTFASVDAYFKVQKDNTTQKWDILEAKTEEAGTWIASDWIDLGIWSKNYDTPGFIDIIVYGRTSCYIEATGVNIKACSKKYWFKLRYNRYTNQFISLVEHDPYANAVSH